MSYSVKNIRKKFHDSGIFYTNNALAEYMKSFLPDDVKEVYDPTCGHGNLLAVFDDNVKKYGQELNPEAAEEAQKIPNSEIVCGDTLKEPAFLDKKFKAIIANPPFSIKWEPRDDERFAECGVLPPKSKADFAFILHCLYYLAADGVACVMAFPGVCYRGQREGKIREWLLRKNYIDGVVNIAGGEFEDTSISTVLLILRKDRGKKDTVHFLDKTTGKERDVPLSEIAQNDYSLSLSTYIDMSPPPEEIDINAINREVQEHFFQMIQAELRLEIMLHNDFGAPLMVLDTIAKIRAILNVAEKELEADVQAINVVAST